MARIDQLMRENGIRVQHKRRYKATTDSGHHLPVAKNVLERQFAPEARNLVWTSDITDIATDEGALYLAVVIDLFDHEVIGWSMKPMLTTCLVIDALSMAWFPLRPGPGMLFRSDKKSWYASQAYQARHGRHASCAGRCRARATAGTAHRLRASPTATRMSGCMA